MCISSISGIYDDSWKTHKTHNWNAPIIGDTAYYATLRRKHTQSYQQLLWPASPAQPDEPLSPSSSITSNEVPGGHAEEVITGSLLAGGSASSALHSVYYDPLFVDDPELRTGKHRTVMALPSFFGSINHYIKEEDLKKELNARFHQSHPNIHPTVQLTQLRSLKEQLLDFCMDFDIELSVLARALTYLEKLVLYGHVGKRNRKLVACACLLLSSKLSEIHSSGEHQRITVNSVKRFAISKQDIVRSEWHVFASLHFSLHLEQRAYMDHLERILLLLPKYMTIKDYIGGAMYKAWKQGLSEQVSDDDEEDAEEIQEMQDIKALEDS